MKTRPNLAQLVRDLRKQTGLTQEKFAAKLGVTFPTINRWENGRTKPSPLALKQIEKLIRGLGEAGRDLLHAFASQEASDGGTSRRDGHA